MKKTRCFLLAVALALCLLPPFAANADIPKTHAEAFYVNDFADVMSDDDMNYIIAMGEAIEDATGAQVVAVTVTFLDGMDVRDYATDLLNEWKLGESATNKNGLLLLLSVGDRDIYIAVGDDLESQFSGAVIGRYLDDYAIPYLKNNDYSSGMRNTYAALVDRVASMYGVTSPTQQVQQNNSYVDNSIYSDNNNAYYNSTQQQYNTSSNSSGGFMGLIGGVLVVVAVIAVVIALIRSLGGGGMGNTACCLLGWLSGRSSGSTRRRSMWMPPPVPPARPRNRPTGGRSTGPFGGGWGGSSGGSSRGSSGGGFRPSGGSSRPRTGGGGSSRGGGAGRKF